MRTCSSIETKVHSTNTQIVFDATFNILDVAKWPAGSTHDPRILMGSGLRREAPCTSWWLSLQDVLTPYLSPQPGAQLKYNMQVFQLTSENEDILYERYRFSSEGIRYLIILVGPYVGNATKRSCALTVAQCVCVSLRFFATGTYLHTVGDAENISKNTVCLAIRKVVAALNRA
ncbi:hypothetical protein N1851_023089 [Merluccius polli]|uniref:Uncharacterized protein n=1 Tax=Merluccius polli TaxID=89951 RepID=A0AA47MH58_MERPO|nr:hypothetical protein N1851_023089 [Merluccius polli]